MDLGDVFHFEAEKGGALGSLAGAAMSLITDSIMNPLDKMVQAVLDGKWKGKGADAFVAEMTGDMRGGLDHINKQMGDFQQSVGKMVGTFQQAQSEATKIVGQIEGLFGDL